MAKFTEIKERFIQYMLSDDASYSSVKTVRREIRLPSQLAAYIMQVRECNLQKLVMMQLIGDEEYKLFKAELDSMFATLDAFMIELLECVDEITKGVRHVAL